MQSEVFEVTLQGMHSLKLPDAQVLPFIRNGHKRIKVIATFEGNSIQLYAALQKRNLSYFIMFGKRNQKALGVYPNDYFQLQLFEDTSIYGVEVSEELEAVLFTDPEAFTIFESFTAGKKRGIIYAIERYRTAQSRIDKALLLCENLKKGVRNPMDLLKSL